MPHAQPLLPDIVELNGRWLSQKPAIITPDTTLTWSALSDAVNRVANGLIAADCADGARIGILMNNSANMVTAMLGAMRAGAIAVPLNTMVSDPALNAMLEDAGATALIVSTDHAARLSPASLKRSHLCLADGDGAKLPWAAFDLWRAAQSAARPDVRLNRESVCNIIYSSGTTGQPKGIVHTHGVRFDWAHDLAHALRYDSAARTLAATGLYSNITWVGMLCTLMLGGVLVVRKGFDAGDVLATIARERTTHTAMVPVQYQRLLEHPDFASADLSSMRSLMCCGSALPERLKADLFARFPSGIIELYGTTEGAITTLAPEDAGGRMASVGKPLPGEDLRILNDKDEILPHGQAGEIVTLSRFVMREYWGAAAATEAAFWVDAEGRRWLRTGDIGRLDADGFLYVTDRKKDMIISGGQNIYPADLEAVLMRHPAIAECAVIGIPSERWGETPLALVVPRDGAALNDDELLEWANARLGKQQRIGAIERRTVLPRNANGKVLKRELRAPYWPTSSTGTSP